MISIVIPVYNEENNLRALLSKIQKEVHSCSCEIIVVDGGSTDNTKNTALKFGVQFYTSKKSRALQMNKGAEKARFSILYFLHADTFPPKGFLKLICDSIANGNEAGSFRLKFNSTNKLLKVYSWFSRYNWKVCRGGDRSIFVKKELFVRVGCYENVSLMEDYNLVTQLSILTNFIVLPQYVMTSASKYHKYGVIWLQVVYAIIHLLHSVGVKDRKLQKVLLFLL